MIYVCQDCGSEKVEVKEWVKLNTGENCGAVGSSDLNEPENNWCPDCEQGTVIIEKK